MIHCRYSKNGTSRNLILIKVSLTQTLVVDGKKVTKPVTALPHICKLFHLPSTDGITEESVYEHIPTSLHGEMCDKLFEGLELSLSCWCICPEGPSKEIHEEELLSTCRSTLGTLVKQARIE